MLVGNIEICDSKNMPKIKPLTKLTIREGKTRMKAQEILEKVFRGNHVMYNDYKRHAQKAMRRHAILQEERKKQNNPHLRIKDLQLPKNLYFTDEEQKAHNIYNNFRLKNNKFPSRVEVKADAVAANVNSNVKVHLDTQPSSTMTSQNESTSNLPQAYLDNAVYQSPSSIDYSRYAYPSIHPAHHSIPINHYLEYSCSPNYTSQSLQYYPQYSSYISYESANNYYKDFNPNAQYALYGNNLQSNSIVESSLNREFLSHNRELRVPTTNILPYSNLPSLTKLQQIEDNISSSEGNYLHDHTSTVSIQTNSSPLDKMQSMVDNIGKNNTFADNHTSSYSSHQTYP